MKNLKEKLIQGDVLEFLNDEDFIQVWFSKRTNSFCIELNAVVVESRKTFKIFEMQLQNLLKKREIEYK